MSLTKKLANLDSTTATVQDKTKIEILTTQSSTLKKEVEKLTKEKADLEESCKEQKKQMELEEEFHSGKLKETVAQLTNDIAEKRREYSQLVQQCIDVQNSPTSLLASGADTPIGTVSPGTNSPKPDETLDISEYHESVAEFSPEGALGQMAGNSFQQMYQTSTPRTQQEIRTVAKGLNDDKVGDRAEKGKPINSTKRTEAINLSAHKINLALHEAETEKTKDKESTSDQSNQK